MQESTAGMRYKAVKKSSTDDRKTLSCNGIALSRGTDVASRTGSKIHPTCQYGARANRQA